MRRPACGGTLAAVATSNLPTTDFIAVLCSCGARVRAPNRPGMIASCHRCGAPVAVPGTVATDHDLPSAEESSLLLAPMPDLAAGLRAERSSVALAPKARQPRPPQRPASHETAFAPAVREIDWVPQTEASTAGANGRGAGDGRAHGHGHGDQYDRRPSHEATPARRLRAGRGRGRRRRSGGSDATGLILVVVIVGIALVGLFAMANQQTKRMQGDAARVAQPR